MLSNLSAIDKVSIVALAKNICEEYEANLIGDLAKKLEVPLMSESRNRKILLEKILPKKNNEIVQKKDSSLANKLVSFLLTRSGAYFDNENRRSYAPWFKTFMLDCKQDNSYNEISNLTGVSIDTLMGFKGAVGLLPQKETTDHKSNLVINTWNTAPPYKRKTLDEFWNYLGTTHPCLSISLKEMREVLINYGLRYPRGPKIKNSGAQVKQPFSPHAIWEGDAKQIKIYVNGEEFIYSWYAFVDQKTTLLVGSNIDATESSTNFLNSLKKGNMNAKTYSIGVLIDNRLSDIELSSINKFCEEHNIVIVRTFPGNSKSNGNIENNFSIFEQFVGDIHITGSDQAEISKSVAQAIIEVFTQQRNHRPRKRLNNRTPAESTPLGVRPEHERTAIEKLRDRLNKQEKNINTRWELIEASRKHFSGFHILSEDKMKKILLSYTATDIIAAQASYLAQIAKYSDNKYGAEYFLAILRNKREEKVKKTYNEAFRAGFEKGKILFDLNVRSTTESAKEIIEELLLIQEQNTPTHRYLQLDALSWWLVNYSARNNLRQLWETVTKLSEINIRISLKWWTEINEYLFENIGELLYSHSAQNKTGTTNYRVCIDKARLESDNLSCFA